MKLSIIPRTIPNGRLCPPPPAIDEERIIGKSGQIHGASIVTNPDRKAKPSSRNMINKYAPDSCIVISIKYKRKMGKVQYS